MNKKIFLILIPIIIVLVIIFLKSETQENFKQRFGNTFLNSVEQKEIILINVKK